MNQHDLKNSRECYFAAGGIESDVGPRADSTWYWRRAAMLWRDKAGQSRVDHKHCFAILKTMERDLRARLEHVAAERDECLLLLRGFHIDCDWCGARTEDEEECELAVLLGRIKNSEGQ